MNKTLKEMVETGKPKLPHLEEKEIRKYQFGLLLLSSFVCEDFLDLPVLSDHKYDTDGLFYTISYLHDSQLGYSGTSRTLLVVWKIENRSSFCPLRIDVDITDEKNFSINVYDQSGERTIKRSLISNENGTYYTEIEGYETRTLSQLVTGGIAQ
ncbi:hypothetical protein CVD28_02670 [Bacillus sp. M6-12]|uniref:hypothetical protein n=1 Tax=Bacillus sp. M6-12 TaxID=2054166 RepID=UPI000C77EC78|nr:hypothetical protein [Bacillus sp. M6-12]PLS19336.1 hypothetical protein CVD28_02670 [Bacillus sp. M6-12]